MNKQTFLVVFLLALFLMPIVSASLSNLGLYKTGQCIDLKQICSTCSYNSITKVSLPDSTVGMQGALLMTKTGTSFNYTFCNTTQAGLYSVDGVGDKDGTDTIWNYNFEVTATGSDATTGKSLTYMFLFLFSVVIFFIFLFVGLSVPGKNKTDEMTGFIIAVSSLKYVKFMCLGFAWVTGLFISYLAWMISFAYLDFQFMTSVLHFIFIGLAAATVPAFVIFILIIGQKLFNDTKIAEQLGRGFEVKG